MFAVVKTGGKQYRVAAGQVLVVEKLAGEAGERVVFDAVLMLGDDEMNVGEPLVAGASVRAEVVEQTRGPKVISFVKRRRKHSSQRRRGHRQELTKVRITEIVGGAKSKVAKAEAKAETAAAEPADALAE